MVMTLSSICLKLLCLQNCMGTLYGHNNLPQLCTMLKDIYACKPQAAASSTTTTPGASAPFTMIQASPRTPEPTLEDKLTHLTDTLYRMGH